MDEDEALTKPAAGARTNRVSRAATSSAVVAFPKPLELIIRTVMRAGACSLSLDFLANIRGSSQLFEDFVI
jgi:hypothetical protein